MLLSSCPPLVDKPFSLGVIVEELSRLDFPMAEWRILGLFLGITDPVLQAIAMSLSSGNQKRCLVDMLSSWLQQDVTASWEGLDAALRKLQFNTVAIQVEKKNGELNGWVLQLVFQFSRSTLLQLIGKEKLSVCNFFPSLYLPVLPCSQPTSCSISNTCTVVFYYCKEVRRRKDVAKEW